MAPKRDCAFEIRCMSKPIVFAALRMACLIIIGLPLKRAYHSTFARATRYEPREGSLTRVATVPTTATFRPQPDKILQFWRTWARPISACREGMAATSLPAGRSSQAASRAAKRSGDLRVRTDMRP
jgi:hypothetical protein